MNPAPRFYDGPIRLVPRKADAPPLPVDLQPDTGDANTK